MKPWYAEMLRRDDPALRAEVAHALLERREIRRSKAEEHAGRIVEFLRGKGHLCGILRPRKGTGGWKVLDQDGRERNVRRAKIVDVARERVEVKQRDEIVRILKAINCQREEMKAGLELRTLWEVASEAGERLWSLDELVDLYFGERADSDQRAALARALDDGHWFDRMEMKFSARSAEVVDQVESGIDRRREQELRMHGWATWLREAANGRESERPEGADRAIELLEMAVLQGMEGEEVSRAARLMGMAHLHGPLAAFELLVKLGHWDADENLELRRQGLPVDYSAEMETIAEGLSWKPTALKGRIWRGGSTYGFAEAGEDCDRAISIRRTLMGYRIGVHLASPVSMEEDERIEVETKTRAASVHLPERLIPMLPSSLVAACRLTPAERRPALSVEMRLGRDLSLKKVDIAVRRVRPKRVVAWDEGGKMAERGLKRLHEIALRLRTRREAAGALMLPEEDVKLQVREGKVEAKLIDGMRPARLICKELTILAGCAVGTFCRERSIPAVYRTASEPTERLPVEGNERVRAHGQIRFMPSASTQVRAGRHEGLGVENYAPVSQPLHRYTDWLLHRQLANYAECGRPLFSAEELEKALTDTTWAREAIGRVEREGRRYWLMRYLEERQGELLEGVILERRGRGYFVELDECRYRGFVAGGREMRGMPGDGIRVKVAQASARKSVVRLEEAV